MSSENQIVIRPQKGSQEIAFNSEADVIIYGGRLVPCYVVTHNENLANSVKLCR